MVRANEHHSRGRVHWPRPGADREDAPFQGLRSTFLAQDPSRAAPLGVVRLRGAVAARRSQLRHVSPASLTALGPIVLNLLPGLGHREGLLCSGVR